MKSNPESRFRRSHAVLAVCAIALVILALVWILPVNRYLAALLNWTEGLGFWGPLVVILTYITATVLFLPGSVLTLGSGFLFGVLMGTVWASIGSTLGAAAAFLVGRTVARDRVAKKISGRPKFGAIDEAVGEEGAKIVFLTRLSPVFPFNLLNYAFGLTRVSFRHYFFASWIGMLPGTLMYVYLGSAARSLAQIAAGRVEGGTAQRIFFWMGLAATVVVAVLVTRIARRALKEKISDKEA
ncbi:MAG: TVP38/TMEM64 family protein [Desulfobacterales bacterium]